MGGQPQADDPPASRPLGRRRDAPDRRRGGDRVVGGTLLTAAGAGTVAVAWGAVVSIGVVLALFAGMSSTPAGAIGGTAAQRLAQYVRAEQVAKISPRDRAVFNAWQGSPEERAAKARALAESASGEDRKVFWANYATQMMVLYKEDAHGGKPHPGAMADAIEIALEDPDAAQARAKALRERIFQHFSQKAMVEGVLAGYRDAFANH